MSFLFLILLMRVTSPTFGESDGRIRGLVLDAGTGSPVAGAMVEILSSDRVALTDEGGRFEIETSGAGPQELQVTAAGYGPTRRTITVGRGDTAAATIPLSAGENYTEELTVSASAAPPLEKSVPAQQTLGTQDLQSLRSALADDPLRAVQTLSGVATVDDFSCGFSVRGSDYGHVGISLDGVPNPLLVHVLGGAEEAGSVAMINTDTLESATLASGAYPQRFGNRTGAQLDFRTRPGSRERTLLRGTVSATSTSVVLEGPLGSARRGSWLLAARKSYLDWLVRQMEPRATSAFGFTDVQSKLVYDFSPRHQIDLSVLAGDLTYEDRDEHLRPGALKEGETLSGLVNLSWRYIPGSRALVTQRIYAGGHGFENRDARGTALQSGSQRRLGYRLETSYAPGPSWLIEAGGAIEREHDAARGLLEGYSEETSSSSGFGQVRWSPSEALSVNGGARVDHWSLTGTSTLSPWLELERKAFGPVRLRLGTGLYRQAPTVDEVWGVQGKTELRPERAWHFDLALEQSLGGGKRWQVTFYDREERDFLRLPDAELRLQNGRLSERSETSRYQNSLTGAARGIELLVERRSANGLSGWASYALGVAHYTDSRTGEHFRSDYDQRHTLNVFGRYRFSNRWSASATFRAGSNYPIAGYYEERDDRYFVAETRNGVGLPAYSRLDLRGSRSFDVRRHCLTLFVEVLNVLNRTNFARSPGWVRRDTGEAHAIVQKLFPLVPSAGIRLEF